MSNGNGYTQKEMLQLLIDGQNRLHDRIDDLEDKVIRVEDNLEFIKCDQVKCEEYGKSPLCYFHIHYNCYLYPTKRREKQRTFIMSKNNTILSPNKVL